MPKTKSPESNFNKDLRKLQDKYPMCTIDAWVPEDYEQAIAMSRDEDPDLDDLKVDWSDPKYVQATQVLRRRHDANIGINWEVLQIWLEDII